MDVKIDATVGRGGTNNIRDVRKIEKLLKTAGLAPLGGFRAQIPLRISDDVIRSIEAFQRLYGKADGLVEPNKKTLGRLNALCRPLQLNAIARGRISKGGYLISYTGAKPPAPYKVKLHVSSAPPPMGGVNAHLDMDNCLDVTGRRSTDLLGSDNLPDLLKIIKRQKLWGKEATCALCVTRDRRLITASAPKSMACPVKPISGALKPEIGTEDDRQTMVYTGIQTGRMLHHVALDGDYYFKFGGKFETDNAQRGLNCITYIGSIYAVDSTTGAMGSYGTQLADELDAERCDMEGKKEKDIKEFFKTNNAATYIMWSSTHSVLVVNGTLYEFSLSKNGYVKTKVENWNFHGKTYWVRKVTKPFG